MSSQRCRVDCTAYFFKLLKPTLMKKILLIFLTTLSGTLLAQDPQLSQYYQAPLYLNPAFAGVTPQHRAVVNHRVQWPSLPQAFATYMFSYDLFIPELRSGFGVLFSTDKMGSAGWRTTNFNFLYSYKLKLSEKFVFAPAVSFGYGTNGLDRSRLILGDQLRYDGETADVELRKLGRMGYFDFTSGFLLYSRKAWLGGSFSHMNEPNLSVLNETSRLPMKTAIHAGFRFDLSANTRTGRAAYFTPSLMYRTQGPSFSQFDFSLNYHVDPVSVGLAYRGKFFKKSVINSMENDAMVFFLGLYLKQFHVGYSYDFTVSELQTSSGGAHELSIVWEFMTKPANRAVKQKYKLIPCPTFNSKAGFWD
jgi:type IX secretion system PorP/SprF family membrane protein